MTEMGQKRKTSMRANVFRFGTQKADIAKYGRHVRLVQILLQKSVEGFREQ